MVDETQEKATAILFTSMTCPHCPTAKELFKEASSERDDADFHDLMTHEAYAQRLSKKFGVQSVPTVIIYGPGHPQPMGLVGAQAKETLHKYLDIALGKKAHEEAKPLFPKLKNFFKKLDEQEAQ